MKKQTKSYKVNPSDYYDKYGQNLADNGVKEITLKVETDEDYDKTGYVIKYKEFFSVSIETLKYLKTIFNAPDMGRISELPGMLKSSKTNVASLNALYKTQRTAHTKESLCEYFEMSERSFKTFFKKLYDHNIIAIVKTKREGKELRLILLNPNFAKRHTVSEFQLKEVFSKIGVQKLHRQNRRNSLIYKGLSA